MLNRLMGTGMENFEFFDQYGTQLAAVSKQDFTDMLSICKEHETITLVGPAKTIEAQLKEKNIEYTLVDWEAERRKLLTDKERKKEDKKKKKSKKK